MENKYAKMIMQNLSHVVLVVLLLMLGGVYFIRSKDKAFVLEGGTGPGAMSTPAVATPDPIVTERMAPKPPIDKTSINVVKVFDMFDRQTIQDVTKRQQDANVLFGQAQALHTQGNLKEALDKIDEIFRVYPPHIEAKELRNTILREMAKKEAEGAAGTAETVAPAPVTATPSPAPTPTPAA